MTGLTDEKKAFPGDDAVMSYMGALQQMMTDSWERIAIARRWVTDMEIPWPVYDTLKDALDVLQRSETMKNDRVRQFMLRAWRERINPSDKSEQG